METVLRHSVVYPSVARVTYLLLGTFIYNYFNSQFHSDSSYDTVFCLWLNYAFWHCYQMKIVLRQSILLFAGVWWSVDKTLQSSFDHDTDNNNNNNNNNKPPLFGLSQTTQPQHTYKKLPRRTAEPVPARRPSITAGFSTGKEAATRGAKRLQSTTPGFYPVSLHQMAPPERGNAHPITAYSSFIDLERMKGWVGLVGWPVDGRLSHRPCHDTDTLLKFRQQTFMNMTYWWHSDSCTQKEKKIQTEDSVMAVVCS